MNIKKILKNINANLFVYLVLFLLISIFFKENRTFYNLYKIGTLDYNQRISKNYEKIFYSGFCHRQSHGYLFYIKDKFPKLPVPEVINFQKGKKVPWWIFYKTNYKTNDKYLILLNFNLADKKEFDFSKYTILDNFKNNCYFLEKND